MRNARMSLALGLALGLSACSQPVAVIATRQAASGVGAEAANGPPGYHVAQRLRLPSENNRPVLVALATHLPTQESLLLERINFVRRGPSERPWYPRPRVSVDPQLAKAAQEHAWQMAIHRTSSQQSPDGKSMADRLREAGATATSWGANAVGPVTASTPNEAVAAVLQAMERNPAHSANLLNSGFTRVGIGAYQSTSNGKNYYAVVFAN